MTVHQTAYEMGLILATAPVDLGDERECLVLLATSQAGLAPLFSLTHIDEHFDTALEHARIVHQARLTSDLRSAA